MNPVIGITCKREDLANKSINRLDHDYIDAVCKSGGLPIILPVLKDDSVFKDYVRMVDGIIFTGGGDVSPLYFDEEPIKEVTSICPDRDKTEIELFHHAHKKGIPILGICRGMQLINIALGGDIYQDIYKEVPGAIGHVCESTLRDGHHTIDIIKDSRLYEIMRREKLIVNSFHHQSVKNLGKGLKATSFARDGLIESVESATGNFIMGLQFHPEKMITLHRRFLGIFDYFIGKCGQFIEKLSINHAGLIQDKGVK